MNFVDSRSSLATLPASRAAEGAMLGAAQGGVQGAVIDLRGIFRTLRRRWAWIAVPALLCGGLAIAAALMMPPRYVATAKVLIDPRGIQVLQNDLRPNNPTGDETGAEVESQVQVIASTSLLRGVAERLGLATDPEFADPPPNPLARGLAAIRGLFVAPPTGPAEAPLQKALRTLQNDVSVARSEKTFVIDIGVRTSDPDKSTRIANAIAEAFVRETSSVRSDAARRSSGELSARLDELRKRLQDSEAKVEAFRKKADLIIANGRLVTEQQLADLNTQLTLARTRAADQQARIAEIQRMGSGGKPADAIAEIANSPTIVALQSQYTDAARAEAEARLNYGRLHPAMLAAQKQMQTVRQRMSEEVARLTRTAQSDYDRARVAETTIQNRIDALKRESSSASEAQVRLRELERQAAADRGVYESFLNRAKDLDERQGLDTGNARVITAAVPPLGRAGLSRGLVVAGGFALGAVMGLGLALLREQFDGTIRSREQLASETHLPVVAISLGESARDAAVWRVRGLLATEPAGSTARVVVVAGLGAPSARARLAQVLAYVGNSEGERTTLIDGDLSGRVVTRAIGAEDEAGLSDLLDTSSGVIKPTPRSFNGLKVIPAGTRGARPTSVSLRTLQQALEPFTQQPGLVVIDGGAIGPDLMGFAALADDILIVVEGGKTVMKDLREALDGLAFHAERIRGILVADRPAA